MRQRLTAEENNAMLAAAQRDAAQRDLADLRKWVADYFGKAKPLSAPTH